MLYCIHKNTLSLYIICSMVFFFFVHCLYSPLVLDARIIINPMNFSGNTFRQNFIQSISLNRLYHRKYWKYPKKSLPLCLSTALDVNKPSENLASLSHITINLIRSLKQLLVARESLQTIKESFDTHSIS